MCRIPVYTCQFCRGSLPFRHIWHVFTKITRNFIHLLCVYTLIA
jgi:hypothetical protein